MAAYIGADPGEKGAVAVIDGNALFLFATPLTWQKRGRSQKALTDLSALRALFVMLSDVWRPERAFIEKVWGIAGQGASTGATLAHHRCALESACVWSSVPHELVSPQRWKADLDLYNKPKDAAIELASRVFPSHAQEFQPIRKVRTTEQCIGRADAALIAYHGRLSCA